MKIKNDFEKVAELVNLLHRIGSISADSLFEISKRLAIDGQDEDWISYAQAAEMLRIKQSSLRVLICNGKYKKKKNRFGKIGIIRSDLEKVKQPKGN